MSRKFVEALATESNLTTTTNGQVAMKSTGSELVNLFGEIGALRNRTQDDICRMFSRAYAEDALLATKMSFYARDIRQGGLGERSTARVIWRHMAKHYPDVMRKNLDNVPTFGRWDDLYSFIGTPIEKDMWDFMRRQMKEDLANMVKNKPISLMGKWLKSVNATSQNSRNLGIMTAKNLGLPIAIYRKTLSRMRKYIDVVERSMSYGKWEDIKYSSVPSYAMKNYRNAFRKHDYDRFRQYLDSVKKGKAVIHSGTLFPYDIVHKYLTGVRQSDTVLEEQWKALPNYVTDNDKSVLVMCDTSGSMTWNNNIPLSIALSLSIYFAERNKGEFHNKFLTFSRRPELQSIIGSTLWERVYNLRKADWESNTDLNAAFSLVLNTAISHNMESSDLPTTIMVISDMQIDSCANTTFYSAMKKRFEKHGYKIPKLVFWNVNASRDTFHTSSKDDDVILVSGASASTFRKILNTTVNNPYDFMVETLNNPVYDCVTL